MYSAFFFFFVTGHGIQADLTKSEIPYFNILYLINPLIAPDHMSNMTDKTLKENICVYKISTSLDGSELFTIRFNIW